LQKGSKAIIYIDEIDKNREEGRESLDHARRLRRRRKACTGAAENSGGTIANVPPQGGRKHPHQEFTPVDTTKFFFCLRRSVCRVGENYREARRRRFPRISHGLRANDTAARNTELLEQVQPGDLIRYGLIPEFVGGYQSAGRE